MNRAELEALLEGVPLPARRDQLVEYAAEQGGDGGAVRALRSLPARVFRSLDEVGEELDPVQPPDPGPARPRPRAESGTPPGGPGYTARP